MQWLTRLLLGLPPREQDIRELQDTAPELFSSKMGMTPSRPGIIHLHRVFLDSLEFREAIQTWVREYSGEKEPFNNQVEPCDHPFCRRKGNSDNKNESPHAVMEMMVVGGGKHSNPPAKSFFNMLNSTKKKKSKIKLVIMTDPYIYSDIGQTGSEGGFDNLIQVLKHLNINDTDTFELQLTPKGINKKDTLQKTITLTFPNCSLSTHRTASTFHDRFILVEYEDGDHRGWYGPSLNGLSSDSIIIFGDITDRNTLQQLSKMLLN